MQRLLLPRKLDGGLEALHLAPVGVPIDLEVGEPEVIAVEHDHPGARSEDGPLIRAGSTSSRP